MSTATLPATLPAPESLSPWWGRAVGLVMVIGFAVLIMLSVKAYDNAPPIPAKAVTADGEVVFTADDVSSGQEVFLKYGLMNNGTIWGHGGIWARFLGADTAWPRTALRRTDRARHALRPPTPISGQPEGGRGRRGRVGVQDQPVRCRERHAHASAWTPKRRSMSKMAYWTDTSRSRPRTADYRGARVAIRKSCASSRRFSSGPRGPRPPSAPALAFVYQQLSRTIRWSATTRPAARCCGAPSAWCSCSAASASCCSPSASSTTSAGTAVTLNGPARPRTPRGLSRRRRPQRSSSWWWRRLLFLVQALIGGAVAHYRAEPGDFYGFDLSRMAARATCCAAGTCSSRSSGLRPHMLPVRCSSPLRSAVAIRRASARSSHVLFWALVVVVVGSLLGQWAGIKNLLGELWFWIGNQGWEYLEIGRFWQILLAAGLLFWFWLVLRAVRTSRAQSRAEAVRHLLPDRRLRNPVLLSARLLLRRQDALLHRRRLALLDHPSLGRGLLRILRDGDRRGHPLPAGLVRRITAIRVIYLDAILYFGGGLIGTAHHWYFTGQTPLAMALGATFSALEVVPLTLLTLDAWDFYRLTQPRGAGRLTGTAGRSTS